MKKLLFILSTVISLNAFASANLPSTSKISSAHQNTQMKHETMQRDPRTRHNGYMTSHYQPHYPAI